MNPEQQQGRRGDVAEDAPETLRTGEEERLRTYRLLTVERCECAVSLGASFWSLEFVLAEPARAQPRD